MKKIENVPTIKLSNTDRIPAIGLGTFGSDSHKPSEIAAALEYAIEIGYRHIDCARVYANEKIIGASLQKIFSRGLIKREDLWITSKLWNDMHSPENVLRSCKQSLADLQLDYLDLYLVHWPFPNHHQSGVSVDSRDQNARPYIHGDYMLTWQAMENLVEQGLSKYIGSSNMSIPKLKLLLRDARIKPRFNEMELHPHFQQKEFFKYLQENAIEVIGYAPIGSPGRPERDRRPEDTVDIEDPTIKRIAQDHGLSPAQICLKWALQRGHIPIPFSSKKENIYANLAVVLSPKLSKQEMQVIAQLDKNSRLIKGQVFLWKEGQSWEELWDLDGSIKS